MTEAVISVILKKGKDPQECGSYHPISLLCCDGKLLTKLLATRVNCIIKSIINPDQVGFVKGRRSSDNLRRLLHIMWKAKNLPVSVAALSLDAEKAFNRVGWDYLNHTLKTFGFGTWFRNIIKLIYKHPKSMVTTNGLRSAPFQVSRGTKQGCPLSPLQSIIALEPLVETIRSHEAIKGVRLGYQEHKLLIFADDILVLISHPQESVPPLLDTVNKFSEISGYKVNWSKSEVMPLSKHCQKNDFREWRFQWIHKNMKYLAIILNPGLANMIKDNFEPLLQKIQLLFKGWDKHLISLWGRAQVIKMVVAPKLIYTLSMLPLNIPSEIFKSIDKMFSEFIWAGKRARMRLGRLQATARMGGLKIPNMQFYQEAFLMTQICSLRLESNNRPQWVQIEEELNKPFNAADYLSQSCQTDNPIMLYTKTIWHKVHKREKSSAFLSKSASPWNNPLLRIEGKPLYWKDWHNGGVTSIGCLYEGHTLKSFVTLREQFNLQRNDWWRYFLLGDWLFKISKCDSKPPLHSDIDEQLAKHSVLPRTASLMYTYLICKYSLNTGGLKAAWERDLGTTFNNNDWDTLVEKMLLPMRDARSKLTECKIFNRIYFTPAKLKVIALIPPGACWRCNSSLGDIVHMFFSCSLLTAFWQKIMEKISNSLGTSITINASLCLLNITKNIKDVRVKHLQWLEVAITTAKRVILRHWKDNEPPTYQEWFNTLAETASYERLIYKINNDLDTFSEIWEPFLTHSRETSIN